MVRYVQPRPIQARQDVTVCIAAVCEFPLEGGLGIIACSDRMITTGATTFQPQTAKKYGFEPIANNVMGLIAGNISPQVAIFDATYRRLLGAPSTKTRNIAEMYAQEFAAFQRRIAQEEVLDPFGLTHSEFVERQRRMDPEFIRRIAGDLSNISVGIETIIAGVDDEGAHLYVVRDRASVLGSGLAGTAHIESAVGFAAIGMGAEHAYSQFSLANYARRWPLSRALFLLYSAKRRAEIAPGVGDASDWYFITRSGASALNDEIIRQLDKEYRREVAVESKRRHALDERVEAFVQDIVKTPPPKPLFRPLVGAPTPPPASTDGS